MSSVRLMVEVTLLRGSWPGRRYQRWPGTRLPPSIRARWDNGEGLATTLALDGTEKLGVAKVLPLALAATATDEPVGHQE